MSDVQTNFQRYEKKYLLTAEQYQAVRAGLAGRMLPDRFSRYTICNVYYDTRDFRLIRASLEKPLYKEKLRVRSYGPAVGSDPVFVELKKKYDGVVYKRRITAPAAAARQWLAGGEAPESSQIQRELDWFRRRLPLAPRVFIGYDREAYAGAEDGELRLTFDTNLRWRNRQPELSRADGYLLLPRETVLMELKIPGVLPLWLSRLLSANHIYPTSFSKYGAYYRDVVCGGRIGEYFGQEVRKSA
ncbi:MAG: polyphosphate polymerase domain-containing protein [Firmicutes bacterium]|nr:polyphosphate polymerase domain-containing protein [Bacillota bacterium]